MPQRKNVNAMTGEVSYSEEPLSLGEAAAVADYEARAGMMKAKADNREMKLRSAGDDVRSVQDLREKVNEILEILRGEG